jgi:hypothetical protein
MAQDYDKIFKENIEQIILPLAEKILHIRPQKLLEIPDDLQRTIERKPDFLKIVAHNDSSKDYVLQIEFQKEDEGEMVYRMHEYYAMLLRKYKMDVYQYVFYIDKRKPTMPTTLKQHKLDFAFELINLQDFDYQDFIKSDVPEEVILAILANFGKAQPIIVIQQLLERLKSLPIETLRREKCVKQLEILSNLRNLQLEIIKQLENMALTYDLENDIRFKQGIEKGIEQEKVQTIQAMLLEKMKPEQIAKITKTSLDFVKKIANSLKK